MAGGLQSAGRGNVCCDARGRITVLLVLVMPRPPGMACVDSGNNLKGAVYDGMHRLVATCLWLYICEYAASLLEAYVFVVILDACTLGR